ncbi:MAG: hypothetical protein L0H75_10510 [Nitrosospira sp.]|nr:hypothetical protein [Nitrosospira sp.]
MKNRLQKAGRVERAKGRGRHRKRRERAPLPGMMVHQDGSRHAWVGGGYWGLIVTMDDATGEHYSMFFVEEEGSASSFRGVGETRGRSERTFATRQGRLPRELAAEGIDGQPLSGRDLPTGLQRGVQSQSPSGWLGLCAPTGRRP